MNQRKLHYNIFTNKTDCRAFRKWSLKYFKEKLICHGDTKDHPEGVWTLPPSLRLKEHDKEKYLAIGESDRMTLKFVKPK